jgi:hypothetical protein
VVESAGVVGMVSGRYTIDPRTQTWMRDAAWAIKSDRLMTLLGIEEPGPSTDSTFDERAQRLLAALNSAYSKEELDVLAFAVGVHVEDLSGNTRKARVLSLINQVTSQGRLDDLIQALRASKRVVADEYDL